MRFRSAKPVSIPATGALRFAASSISLYATPASSRAGWKPPLISRDAIRNIRDSAFSGSRRTLLAFITPAHHSLDSWISCLDVAFSLTVRA